MMGEGALKRANENHIFSVTRRSRSDVGHSVSQSVSHFMMIMVMVTMMVNVCDDDCYLVMKVLLVKEVMSCDVSPVAMFKLPDIYTY